MCGIVGFSGKRHANSDKLALLMLHNSLKRGEDNTGIYSLETGVIKTATKAEEFLAKMELPRTNMFIGHVRKASVGMKTETCAHPYEYDNIVLAHNGTLNNHWNLCTDAGYKSADFDTDSQVLTKLLDDDSKKEKMVFSTLSNYTGAAALLFTDKRNPNTLYAYRNSDRPLCFGFIDGSMYISSLEENLKIIGCRDIKEFSPSYVHTIKFGKVTNSMFYKQKTVIVNNFTNHYSGYGSRATNVNYKDTSPLAEELFSSIRKVDALDPEKLIGRWVQAECNASGKYAQSVAVKVTRGNWYFVEDVATDNSYDIQFKDDNSNYVWNNKYIFNVNHIDYPTNYGISTVALFDEKEPKELMFNEGSVIQLAPNTLITKDNLVSCINGDEVIDIDLSYIRPALKEEVDAFLEAKVGVINDKLGEDCGCDNSPFVDPTAGNQLALGMPCNVGKSEKYDFVAFRKSLELKESLDKIEAEEFDKEAAEQEEIADNDTPNDINVIQDAEYVNLEDDDTANVLAFVLDKIDNVADDICDLVDEVKWDKLKEKSAELKDIINESYNVQNVRHFMENS